jgi:anthranilate phosphoribosyltransferase
MLDASRIVTALLEDPPTPDFLARTGTDLAPATLAGVVRALRPLATLPAHLAPAARALSCTVVDVCGTGGIRGSRLNVSTLTALFAPDLGVAVVKHGGRSSVGRMGSLDLLERLGLALPFLYENAAECLRTTGLAYLAAGLTYGPFARYAAARRAYGRPSVFNLLGPLLNPVLPTHHLLGAWSPEAARLLAETVALLGESAFVVCATQGDLTLDEASPFGETLVLAASPAGVNESRIPAVEDGPTDLASLFEDGGAAASDLLEGRDDERARVAASLVAYNLAFVGLLDRPDAVAESVVDAYRGIRASFPERCSRARARIARLAAVLPEHSMTPIRIPPTVGDGGVPAAAPSLVPPRRDAFRPLVDLAPGRPGWVFAEVKLRTPLRAFSGPSLEERVAAYVEGGAEAISVVTHPSFGGSLDLLRRVRALTDRPIVAKDFLRRPDEVAALARAGADGVLLLLDLIGPAAVQSLAEECVRHGVTPFVESSWGVPDPLPGIPAIPVCNARSLFSLAEGRFFRDAAARSAARGRPGARALLASGADDPMDVVALRRASRGVIVGTALMKLGTGDAIVQFLRKCSASRLVLKACGAASADDVQAALDAGADLVGVNLVPGSRRRVGDDALGGILAAAGRWPRRLVFVTSSASRIPGTGPGGVAVAAWEQPYGLPVLGAGLGLLLPFPEGEALGLRLRVLDGPRPGAGLEAPYPPNRLGDVTPVLVAGGVDAGNVARRMAEARAAGWVVAGADAASGVEGEGGPGRFDPARIRALRQALDGVRED